MGHTKIEGDGADKLSTVMPYPGLETPRDPGHPSPVPTFRGTGQLQALRRQALLGNAYKSAVDRSRTVEPDNNAIVVDTIDDGRA